MKQELPIGKLSSELLARLIERAPVQHPRLVIGPRVGFDCAVVDHGSGPLLVYKSDPITFTSDEIGWYLVQVNVNDIATCGAIPRWLITTMLLPEANTTPELVDQIGDQVFAACRELEITVIGGHTEITAGLTRPILVGTLIGEVERDKLVLPSGAKPGDHLLLTKGIPIEATAILGREYAARLSSELGNEGIQRAQHFLFDPGISVYKDAQVALAAGVVTAMHDPTEGGLAAALWELAEACGHILSVNLNEVYIPPISQRICDIFEINPLAAIASGALLLASPADHALTIQQALEHQGIRCSDIGWVVEGDPAVWITACSVRQLLPRPARDEIARIFAEKNKTP